mgnify:CR=1 FL=1
MTLERRVRVGVPVGGPCGTAHGRDDGERTRAYRLHLRLARCVLNLTPVGERLGVSEVGPYLYACMSKCMCVCIQV